MAEKEIRYDVDGYELLTTALRELLNKYPVLSEGDKIDFSTLGAESGKAMFPITGAVIETESTDITGEVRQICRYPFYVIYRASGLSDSQKARVKEWLDNLGRWLERQTIMVDGVEKRLGSYPPLTGRRRFISIERQTPSYLDNTYENKSEDWAIYISARYSNEFTK